MGRAPAILLYAHQAAHTVFKNTDDSSHDMTMLTADQIRDQYYPRLSLPRLFVALQIVLPQQAAKTATAAAFAPCVLVLQSAQIWKLPSTLGLAPQNARQSRSASHQPDARARTYHSNESLLEPAPFPAPLFPNCASATGPTPNSRPQTPSAMNGGPPKPCGGGGGRADNNCTAYAASPAEQPCKRGQGIAGFGDQQRCDS